MITNYLPELTQPKYNIDSNRTYYNDSFARSIGAIDQSFTRPKKKGCIIFLCQYISNTPYKDDLQKVLDTFGTNYVE